MNGLIWTNRIPVDKTISIGVIATNMNVSRWSNKLIKENYSTWQWLPHWLTKQFLTKKAN